MYLLEGYLNPLGSLMAFGSRKVSTISTCIMGTGNGIVHAGAVVYCTGTGV